MRRKMRVTIKTIGLGLLIGLTLLVQNTSALPNSTYGEDNGWEGYKYYNENGFDLVITFNVYDTQHYPDEFTWEGAVEMPDTDRYIYAYQIFSNQPSDANTKDVSYFSILDLDKNPISQSLMHATTAQDDPSGVGIAPDPEVSVKQGAWEWSVAGGYILAGKLSTYLIFSSPYEPTEGSFEIKAPEEQGKPPRPVPEPGMTALLGMGATMLFTRLRKRQSRLR
jgi:hypothetical protein